MSCERKTKNSSKNVLGPISTRAVAFTRQRMHWQKYVEQLGDPRNQRVNAQKGGLSGVLLTWRVCGLELARYKTNDEHAWLHPIHIVPLFLLIMTRLSRRPTRTQSRRLASSLSLLFFACLALLLLCPVAVSADQEKDKYGPVIGIGKWDYV